MNSFRFKDKINGAEYFLPCMIKDAKDADVNLQELIGHIITYSRKKKNRSDERKNISSTDVKTVVKLT